MRSEPLPLEQALAVTHVRAPAEADPASGWRSVGSDEAAGAVIRPPGLRLDSGGLGKGLAADLAAERLAAQATFAVDCAGDIRIGGTGGAPRTVEVADPFGGAPVHRLQVRDGAATARCAGARRARAGDGGMNLAATHLFWITTRGAGLAALLLAGLSVTVGACIHLARGRGADLRTLHETLSVGALLCLGVHGTSLLADPWLHPGLAGVTVPFLGAYRPLWTGLGIIAGYGLAALGLTYYLRERIGPKRWKAAHRFIVSFWALGVVHALGAGTDAGQPWFLIALAAPTLPALALLGLRYGRLRSGALRVPARSHGGSIESQSPACSPSGGGRLVIDARSKSHRTLR